jgi:hypothetical protein
MTDSELEGTPAALPANETKRRGTRRRIVDESRSAGADLLPEPAHLDPAAEARIAFWVGSIPASPVNQIEVAGIGFPKVNESVRQVGGVTTRIPVIGAIVHLTRGDIDELRKRLPRTVIRFTGVQRERGEVEPQYFKAEGGGVSVLEAMATDERSANRKGFVITIPSREELEERRKNGFAAIPYQQGRGDEPAACYLFAEPCANQEDPRPGDRYPDTLDKTGLYWPGD